MKRTSKKKHINQNQSVYNSGKKQENKPKSTIKTNHKNLFIGFIFGIVVFIINRLFFTPDDIRFLQLSLSKSTFIFISLILSGLIVYIFFKIEEKQAANISKYAFLILLLYSISISLIPIKEYSNEFVILYNKLIAFQTLLIVPTIVLGIIAIWIHKTKMQEVVDNLFAKNETSKEKLNIKDRILFPIKKMFLKKEILTTVGLFVIIGISIATLFYKLDYFDLYSDEAQVTQGAAGYYHTGEYKFWDFAKNKIIDQDYKRAKPHQFIVAQSYKIFGISTWSSRFPSAVLGVILIILSYFIGRYFIKDKLAVLLIIFSFAFYFEFLLLQRWSRMYALLFPLYLLVTYFAYRFIVEDNFLKFSFFKKPIFTKYLNFNYIYLPVLLILLYLNLQIHVNSTFILLVLLLFSIFSAFLFKEKKYIILAVTGSVLLIIQILFPYRIGFEWFTFFDVSNSKYYTQFLLGFPFSINVNIILISIGIFSFFLIRNNNFRKKYLFLILTGALSWVLFSFIIKYSFSFRYVSHIVPLVIFVIIGLYVFIIKVLYSKVIQIIFSLLLVIFVLTDFNSRYNDLYVRNFAAPANTQVAYKTVVDNYKKGEIIYHHWGPAMYYSGIDTSVQLLKLWHRDIQTVIDSLKSNKAGWLVWSFHNQHAMDKNVVDYCNIYFKKYHGYGVDNTNVEVYYCNDSILADTNQLKVDIFFPNANLNFQNSYSVAFWLKVNIQNINAPLLFKEDNIDVVTLKLNQKDSTFICYYDKINFIKGIKIADDKWHHVVWYQEGGKNDNKYGLFIDGKLRSEKKIVSEVSGLVKFQFNKQFAGGIDDIRIYNFILKENQIEKIINNRSVKNTDELISDSEKFKTLFHWQRQ